MPMFASPPPCHLTFSLLSFLPSRIACCRGRLLLPFCCFNGCSKAKLGLQEPRMLRSNVFLLFFFPIVPPPFDRIRRFVGVLCWRQLDAITFFRERLSRPPSFSRGARFLHVLPKMGPRGEAPHAAPLSKFPVVRSFPSTPLTHPRFPNFFTDFFLDINCPPRGWSGPHVIGPFRRVRGDRRSIAVGRPGMEVFSICLLNLTFRRNNQRLISEVTLRGGTSIAPVFLFGRYLTEGLQEVF